VRDRFIQVAVRPSRGAAAPRSDERGEHDGNEVRLPEAAVDGCRAVVLSRGRIEPDTGSDRGMSFAADLGLGRFRKPSRASARAAAGSSAVGG